MAVIPFVLSTEGGATVVTWANMVTGDSGAPVAIAGHSDKTVHVIGTATAFALQGSNDPAFASPATLTDIDAAATPITAAGIFTIKENPLLIAPLLTTGSVTVILVC